jgi:hypothetical protein
MQTKARTSRSLGKHSVEGIVPHRCFTGRKPSKTDKTAGRRPVSNFLNTVFHPFPAIRLNPLFNRNNYDFLYLSARNYSKLLGSSFDFPPQEKNFTELFRYFGELLPHGQHLLLTREDKKLSFKIWFGYDFLIGEVFFIPIEILNKTEGMFRDILLSFFQLFVQTHHFPDKKDLYDYEAIINGYLEEWYEPDDVPEMRDFFKAYNDGYINDTFSLIYQKPNLSTTELEKLIENYTPKDSREENLLASVKQGINIINMKKNIFNYVCRPGKNDKNFYEVDDDCIIEAERLVRLVYSGSDYASENYLEYINAESSDSANEYFPRRSLILTPDTNLLLEVDFIECFFTWLTEFINNLYDYEDK